MTLYTLEACEDFMSQYIENGGECITIEEGSLGLGKVVCLCEGFKFSVITDRYVNPWARGHSIRMYKKIPAKYERILSEM